MKQENVLVIATDYLEEFICPDGINVSLNTNNFFRVAQKEGCFISRNDVENNFNFKQVIPYIYISYDKSIFLTYRKSTQSESRLHNKYSLAVGGHINDLDIEGVNNIIQNGMLRELNEEVIIDSNDILQISAKALISDDTADVGRVHIGVVYQVILKSAKCAINETKKMEGRWIQISDIPIYYEEMETWSKIVYNSILRGAQ